MLQTEVLRKVYESLIFMIPKLNVKHRKIIEDHVSQAYAAGYELGLQNKNRQIPVVLLKNGVVINRYPNIEYAAQSIAYFNPLVAELINLFLCFILPVFK